MNMLYTRCNYINAVLLKITVLLVTSVFVYEAESRRRILEEERQPEKNFSLHKHSKAGGRNFLN